MTGNELSYKIIGATIHLHKSLSPGLLESAYEHVLANDPRELGFDVKQQIPLLFIYKDVSGLKLALLINFNSKICAQSEK